MWPSVIRLESVLKRTNERKTPFIRTFGELIRAIEYCRDGLRASSQ